MLKDDRMMGMLTFVVIMVAVGTLIQRADLLGQFFGVGSTGLELRRDEVIVRANTLSGIDVLANDIGIRDGDGENLIIVEQPKCGRVFVRDGQAHYLPAERCIGSQSFKYAISGRSYGESGEVIVVVRLVEPTQREVAADAQRDIPAPAPATPRAARQRTAGIPALLAVQPSVGGDADGANVPMSRPMPTVPRPQAPAIAGLPDTASGAGPAAAGGGGSTAAGVSFDASGQAPRIAAPAGGLGQAPEIATVPVVPQPAPEAPAPPASEQQTPAPLAPPVLTAPDEPGIDLSQPAPPPGTPTPEPEESPAASVPTDTAGEAIATIALARIDPALLASFEVAGPSIQRENEGLDANVRRSGLPEIGSGATGQTGFGRPADVLAAVRALGDTLELAPVDTTPPEALSGLGAITGTGAAQTAPPPSPPAARVAALPSAAEPCTVPPSLILEVKPAGLTEVIVESPCHARTVAELAYDGLRFGVALDAAGAGAVLAVGFQQASDAVLSFDGGETVDFNIPFADTERMERVAVTWEMPVDLDLHAFEFGALVRSDDHVRPDQPRSYGDVRRRGGGYLLEYRPVDGVGQSVNVYTYWRRHGGRSGVVALKVDFASRDGGQLPDTCGGGALAEPDFTVLRSAAGQLERPRHRRLASLDCTAIATIAGTDGRFIGDAIDDMIIRKR